MPVIIELTVADQAQNGFVSIATWRCDSIDQAHTTARNIDDLVPEGAEGDLETDDYAFILDLHDTDDGQPNMVAQGAKALPLQIAHRLAPNQVSNWLSERPDPDSVCGRWGARLEGLPT